MFEQLFQRMFRRPAGDDGAAQDRLIRRLDAPLPEGLVPAGQALCAFRHGQLVGVSLEGTPGRQNPNEECWLIPRRDQSITVSLKRRGTALQIDAEVRIEPEPELYGLVAGREAVTRADIMAVMARQLPDLLEAFDPAHRFGEADRERLRARLSLRLQEFGLRCTHLAPLRARPQTPMDTAALVFPSGRRILLLAKPLVTLGRKRSNDIVIHFLPRSRENDRLTENISREHVRLELTPQGVCVTDCHSTKGTALQRQRLHAPQLLTRQSCGQSLWLELAVDESVRVPFPLEMTLFGSSVEALPTGVCRTDGAAASSALWPMAEEAGLSALRLRRADSLSDEEEYLLLFREAQIGAGALCPIVVPDARARILHFADGFWLENLADTHSTLVDALPVPRGEPMALAPGMDMVLGDVRMRFEASHQRDR